MTEVWQGLLGVAVFWFCLSVLACAFASIRTPVPGREVAWEVVRVTAGGTAATYYGFAVIRVFLDAGFWPGMLALLVPFVAVWAYWAMRPDVRA
jgi:hypothetical protein